DYSSQRSAKHIVLIRFFFHASPTAEIYTLSLHDALPISCSRGMPSNSVSMSSSESMATPTLPTSPRARAWSESRPICVGRSKARSEEHTSELQSRGHLVCRLLLEKKKQP